MKSKLRFYRAESKDKKLQGKGIDIMPMFEFWLGNEDADRLFSVKATQGKDNLTGNDFARELLERELYRLHPNVPEFDENGKEIK